MCKNEQADGNGFKKEEADDTLNLNKTERYFALRAVIRYLAYACADEDIAKHVETYRQDQHNSSQDGGNLHE